MGGVWQQWLFDKQLHEKKSPFLHHLKPNNLQFCFVVTTFACPKSVFSDNGVYASLTNSPPTCIAGWQGLEILRI
jgi:hypothetical protein